MPIAKHFYALSFILPHKIIIAANDKPKKPKRQNTANYGRITQDLSEWLGNITPSLCYIARLMTETKLNERCT